MVFDMMNGYNAEIEKPSNYMEVEDVELFSSHNLLNLSEAVTMCLVRQPAEEIFIYFYL